MLELIKLGGWMMWPIIACSILAMAITGDRLWTLWSRRVMPPELMDQVWELQRRGRLDAAALQTLNTESPLGVIIAAALGGQSQGRATMKEKVEQAGRRVVHGLERYLNTLGTIASVSPYLGLLGSVLGMMKAGEIANPARLAGGISEILIATAAGLAVAIPSLIFYRYFQSRVAELTVRMEEEALQLIDALNPPAPE